MFKQIEGLVIGLPKLDMPMLRKSLNPERLASVSSCPVTNLAAEKLTLSLANAQTEKKSHVVEGGRVVGEAGGGRRVFSAEFGEVITTAPPTIRITAAITNR